jgi:glutathione S-transferase
MLIIHHLSHSRSQKILWLAEELGIPYELKLYMRDPQTLSAPVEMKALHPLGTSPLMTDNGYTYSETGAIMDYILRHYGEGRLQPDADSAAFDQFMEWMHYAEGSAMLPMLVLIYANYTGSATTVLNDVMQQQIAKHMRYIENALAGVDYLVNNRFSAADIHVSFVGQTGHQYTDMSAYPNITAWIARLEARPAYQHAQQKGGYFGAAKP